MKMFLIVLSFFCFFQQALYAQQNEWISYVPNAPVASSYQTVPLVETQQIITTIIRPAPVIVYSWIPVYINQPVIYEKYNIFCRQRIVVQQPVIYWTYRPIAY